MQCADCGKCQFWKQDIFFWVTYMILICDDVSQMAGRPFHRKKKPKEYIRRRYSRLWMFENRKRHFLCKLIWNSVILRWSWTSQRLFTWLMFIERALIHLHWKEKELMQDEEQNMHVFQFNWSVDFFLSVKVNTWGDILA